MSVNFERVEAIVDNDFGALQEMLTIYLDELRVISQKLTEAVNSNNSTLLREITHSHATSAKLFGISDLQKYMVDCHNLIDQNAPEHLKQSSLESALNEIVQITSIFNKRLGQIS